MKVLFSRSGFPNRRFGIAYTQVDFDDLRDSYGKTASYGTFRQTELTAGIKLEKYLPAENGSAKLTCSYPYIGIITQ